MSKVAIFASGEGSNAARIIHYFKGIDTDIEIALLLSNRQEAGAMALAKAAGIDSVYFANSAIEKGEDVLNYLKEMQIEWIVLAGFLRKIPLRLIEAYPNRIFNIHPSLLPKYGGEGMYGKRVHESVLQNKEAKSGISIHLVNEDYDKGELIRQESCDIEAGETVESLVKKIQKLEHTYFPLVIKEYITKHSIA